MIYLLQAKVVEYSEPVEIEADSLEEAREKIIEDIDSGEIEIEPSQSLNIEIFYPCPNRPHGHRWEDSPHEKSVFCKYCGILEKDAEL